MRFLINSYLISTQVANVYHTTLARLKASSIDSLEDLQHGSEELVMFDDEMVEKNRELRTFLYDHLYSHFSVYRMNKKGQLIIRTLFDVFSEDLHLMPTDYQDMISEDYSKQRVICDYIAGMTDTFALKEYQSIYS